MQSSRAIIFLVILMFVLAAGFFIFRSDILVSEFVENQNSRVLTQDKAAAAAVVSPVSTREKYLVLYSPESDSEDTPRTLSSLCQLFTYTKKQYDVVDPQKEKYSPEPYAGVIVILHDLGLLGDINALARYVEQGGSVFFTSFFEGNDAFRQIYRKLGIIETGDYTTKDGIKLVDDVMLNASELTVKGSVIQNYGLDCTLDEKAVVHALANNNQPLLWERNYGSGKFVVFNGSCLSFKYTRGLLLAGVGSMADTFVYPILNMKLMYIDDFPSPFPSGYNAMIKSEYNCDIKSFYRDIWWADMAKLEKKFGFKYTCVAIETYNDNVKGPFVDLNKDMTNNLRIYGYEIIASGGELGIHGYNHQSLAPEGYIKQDLGYTPWASEADMAESLEELNSFLSSVFHNYDFQVYVPPSNILSPMGRRAVLDALKNVTVLSSVYNESITSDIFVQEFDIADDGIINLPRVTSGYEDSDTNRWSAFSALSSIGVFSHFVHPDDILDSYRSHNASWQDLYDSTNRFLQEVIGNDTWLDAYTASGAAAHLKAYLATNLSLTHERGLWTGLLTSDEPMSFVVRTKGTVAAVMSCTVISQSKDVYIIKTKGSKFEFLITGEKG